MQITDEQLAQLSWYAQATPADLRRAWTTPRRAQSTSTRLHQWAELMAMAERTHDRPTPWRYRTGRRGGVKR